MICFFVFKIVFPCSCWVIALVWSMWAYGMNEWMSSPSARFSQSFTLFTFRFPLECVRTVKRDSVYRFLSFRFSIYVPFGKSNVFFVWLLFLHPFTCNSNGINQYKFISGCKAVIRCLSVDSRWKKFKVEWILSSVPRVVGDAIIVRKSGL